MYAQSPSRASSGALARCTGMAQSRGQHTPCTKGSVRPISLLRLSLLRFVDSTNSLASPHWWGPYG